MDEYQLTVSDNPAQRWVVGKHRAIAEAIRTAAQQQLPVYVMTDQNELVFTAPRNAQARDAEAHDNRHSVEVAMELSRTICGMVAQSERAILALGTAARSLEHIDRSMAADLLRQQASLARSFSSLFGPIADPEGIVPMAAD